MENLFVDMHATGLHWLARKSSNGNGGHWSSARMEIAVVQLNDERSVMRETEEKNLSPFGRCD